MRDFEIAGKTVGRHMPPLVIAEMSGNHNQSLQRALDLVDAAAAAGAHAVKLQTYTADTLTIDCDRPEFRISDPASPWCGRTLYELYQEAYTPWEWHEPIFERARARGLIPLSTPFDAGAVELLERLDAPCYKIASFESTDLSLIRLVARTGKPVIVSVGMATVAEIDDLVRAIRAEGCEDIVLLKCTSTYPASPADSHLRTIPHLRELFDVQVGLSDHTLGIGVAVAAVAFGAAVIEKHFTLRRADGGVDAAFSLEPQELAALAAETERAWQALGGVRYGPTTAERQSLVFRRSIFVTRDLRAGEALTADNIRVIRPGQGLAPRHYPEVLGRLVTRDVKRGTPLAWELLA
ncbi:pseudaminic acid synthase [bacterium]|nr:MAG: pseudaminic acid synthase [bacterium]